MTQPLVDAEAAAAVGQAPRFVSAVAMAQGMAQATLAVAPAGWVLGLAIVFTADRFDQQQAWVIVGVQVAIAAVASALAIPLARRGAAMPAAPMPLGVVLVPRTESRRMMLRTTLIGVLVGFALLAVLSSGSNPSLLGAWSAAMVGIGLGQRARAQALLAREAELGKSLWMPERRNADLPRLAAGPPDPEIRRG